MEPKVIVMITMLVLPGAGDSNVHVRQFSDAQSCIKAADIEASDPFVRHVECAALNDGMLTLRFDPPRSGQPATRPDMRRRSNLGKAVFDPAG